jgi:hypothetical protein
VRRTPATFGLQHVPPEVNLAQDAAERVGFVAPARIRECVDRVACGVEATVAPGTRDRMNADRRCERILVPPALGDERPAVRPGEIV